MPSIAYTASAAADIEAISDALAVEKPVEAERFLSSLRLHCRQLARMDKMGSDRSEFGRGVRSYLVGQVEVFYRRDGQSAHVLRVLRSVHSGR